MPLPIDDTRLRYGPFPLRHLLSYHLVFGSEAVHTISIGVSCLDDFEVRKIESVKGYNQQNKESVRSQTCFDRFRLRSVGFSIKIMNRQLTIRYSAIVEYNVLQHLRGEKGKTNEICWYGMVFLQAKATNCWFVVTLSSCWGHRRRVFIVSRTMV